LIIANIEPRPAMAPAFPNAASVPDFVRGMVTLPNPRQGRTTGQMISYVLINYIKVNLGVLGEFIDAKINH
jgi:hypothetical protein